MHEFPGQSAFPPPAGGPQRYKQPPAVQPSPPRRRAPTADEALLGQAVHAGQVPAVLAAVLLPVLPGVPAAEVSVAVAVELAPGVLAALRVCGGNEAEREKRERDEKRDEWLFTLL